MGIFDGIRDAIFGKANASTLDDTVTSTPSAVEPQTLANTPEQPQPATLASPSVAPLTAPVDVASILDDAVKASGQQLDWRKSIVDLMKALGMESSLSERKELAKELGYTGDMSNSASMNMWLHTKVMEKLKENGGQLPADL
ncbi:DUF3597 domain-containing protein [Ketogulonicigenium vulgare]|uniref:DUF3597 domain-containing protein n=1 Tax=Ketogulonicigenium vulgare TaxID=92945 RepID=UPI0023582E50|nr:DUF3597 domain-containing protein [Ketogulonicigenium vulgare]